MLPRLNTQKTTQNEPSTTRNRKVIPPINSNSNSLQDKSQIQDHHLLNISHKRTLTSQRSIQIIKYSPLSNFSNNKKNFQILISENKKSTTHKRQIYLSNSMENILRERIKDDQLKKRK